MTTETKRLAIEALKRMQGDDYYRAKIAFQHCTPQEMQARWSGNGQTRQQVLDGYKRDFDAVQKAIDELEKL